MREIGQSSERTARRLLGSIGSFSQYAAPRRLRPYQVEAGEAIVRSVLRGEGHTFTVCMARQSGKNELSAQLEAYLLALFSARGGQIVKAAPSFKPQVVNSQMRLQEVLAGPLSRGRWTGRHGYMIELGHARVVFFSADPSANIVGATASLLLEVDEAQDVDEDVYVRDLRPMASTTKATTVLYGTPWTDDNILEVQRRRNISEEKSTGSRLNFEAPWTVLAAISPAYRDFVQAEIDRLGESHPTIRTQYLLEPVAGAGRLFPPRLIECLHGSYRRQPAPLPDRSYVVGIDVAGQVADPTALGSGARVLNDRDETVVTIAEIDFSRRGQGSAVDRSGKDPTTRASSACGIRVVEHYRWRGISHAEQYDRLLHLLREIWNPVRICVDATGVGAGLASFLYREMPTRLEPITFTAPEKSRLGFSLLAATETGRLTIYRDDQSDTAREFWRQMRGVRYKLNASEEMSFAVPSAEGHDDFVMSLALTVRVAELASPPAAGILLRAPPDLDAFGW